MVDQVNEHGKATTLIHFVFQVDPERIACMSNMIEFHSTKYHPNYQRTNSAAAVTCPACKKTTVYKGAVGISTRQAHEFPENAEGDK